MNKDTKTSTERQEQILALLALYFDTISDMVNEMKKQLDQLLEGVKEDDK